MNQENLVQENRDILKLFIKVINHYIEEKNETETRFQSKLSDMEKIKSTELNAIESKFNRSIADVEKKYHDELTACRIKYNMRLKKNQSEYSDSTKRILEKLKNDMNSIHYRLSALRIIIEEYFQNFRVVDDFINVSDQGLSSCPFAFPVSPHLRVLPGHLQIRQRILPRSFLNAARPEPILQMHSDRFQEVLKPLQTLVRVAWSY